VLLEQRHDELPKLVETCRQDMKFEQETLERLMQARSRVFAARAKQDVPELGEAEGALRATLGHLFALAEAYPDLKSNQSFQQLQARISSLEDAIADRREFYNESVNSNNVRTEQFPDALVAALFGFRSAPLLEVRAEEKADVDVKKLFGA
jgi:LemA protein